MDYVTKRISVIHVEALKRTLEEHRVPHADDTERATRILRLGSDAEYEVHVTKRPIGNPKISIKIRFEHPILKKLLADWVGKCGGEVGKGFFTWHMDLSPSVIRGIKARWCVDMTSLRVSPVKLGQIVMVFLSEKNIAAEIADQLATKPRRCMKEDEFIKSAEFAVCGSDPFDTVVYGWRSDAGSQLFVVAASAPAMTMLSLWVFSEQAPVEIRLGELSPKHENQEA